MKKNHFKPASIPHLGLSVTILLVFTQIFFFQSLAANLSAIEIPSGLGTGSIRKGATYPADRTPLEARRRFLPQPVPESILVPAAPPSESSRLIAEPPFDEWLFSRIRPYEGTFPPELPRPLPEFREPSPEPSSTDPYDSLELLRVYDPVENNEPLERHETDESISNPLEKEEDPEDQFTAIVIRAAQKYSVDPAIVQAIIKAESGYNPKAVSHRGAKGLMQLMPNTAKSLGVDDIFCPEQNILAGVKYFKQLLNEFGGNIKLALAAYNVGSGKVKKYKGIPPFKATRLYIKKVFQYHQEYRQELAEKGLNPFDPKTFPSFSSF